MLCDGWLGGYRGCGGGSLTLLIKEGGGSHVSKFEEESESREIYHLTFFFEVGGPSWCFNCLFEKFNQFVVSALLL